ncbi:MAG: radical SAM family heme chaperone HemW [Candidatus Altiarchaeota archaeon]
MRLTHRAKQKLKELNIDAVYAAGIKKSREMFASSCIIVTYPPWTALPAIGDDRIYANSGNKRLKRITVYVHLPFCTGRCSYCGHTTLSNPDTSIVERYINALKRELDLLLEQIGSATVESLYFGGGTPTYLGEKQLEDLIRYYLDNLRIKADVEVTVESSPETLSEKKLRVLADSNVNRLSLGVQTFDDASLAIIGRRHNAREARKAYYMARRTGFDNINIDLMRGLPKTTQSRVEKDLEAVEDLEPPSVSVYSLVLRPNTRMKRLYDDAPGQFPTEEELLLYHIMMNEKLADLGYTEDPVDWFTTHRRFRYQQQIHKWEDMIDSVGMGVSAYGYCNGWQYYNHRNLKAYFDAVENDQTPVERALKLDMNEQMHHRMIFGLKTRVNKKKFHRMFGKEVNVVFGDKIRKLTNAGLLCETQEDIGLSYAGRLFADDVCHEFYSPEIRMRDGILANQPSA